MSKSSRDSSRDCEAAAPRGGRLGATLCPLACALLLVGVFAVSFVGSRLAYAQYDQYCAARRFDFAKLYILPNVTVAVRAAAGQ